MVQVDMRFMVKKRGGAPVYKTCFYINVPGDDADIKCGDFLCVYGTEILNHINKGQIRIKNWHENKTKFPLKLTFKRTSNGGDIVLNNKNIDEMLNLEDQNIFYTDDDRCANPV